MRSSFAKKKEDFTHPTPNTMELYLHQNGEQVGPYTVDQITSMIQSGALTRDDIVWHEGLSEWQPLHTIFDIDTTPVPRAPIPRTQTQTTVSKEPKALFKKIRVGTVLAALILFALPWIDVQCSEKTMLTQTGFQVIYGGGSITEEMESMRFGEPGAAKKSTSEDSMGVAPLVAIALLCVIAAVALSIIALFRNNPKAERYSSILPAVALVLLLLQMMIGFPAKKKILEEMSEKPPQSESAEDPFAALGQSMAMGMMMNIRVKTTTAFYLELLALGIPTLLLLNGYIDIRRKKSESGPGE
jgi:hypothetical protein